MTDSHQPSPSLAAFLAMERDDSKAYWRLASGDHQNLLDEAVEVAQEALAWIDELMTTAGALHTHQEPGIPATQVLDDAGRFYAEHSYLRDESAPPGPAEVPESVIATLVEAMSAVGIFRGFHSTPASMTPSDLLAWARAWRSAGLGRDPITSPMDLEAFLAAERQRPTVFHTMAPGQQQVILDQAVVAAESGAAWVAELAKALEDQNTSTRWEGVADEARDWLNDHLYLVGR